MSPTSDNHAGVRAPGRERATRTPYLRWAAAVGIGGCGRCAATRGITAER